MENQITLNFQSLNNESENLILCLHGNSTNSNYFSPLLKEFEGWHIVAPDYIGHGKSPRLGQSEYNYNVFTQCLVDFISQFSFKKLVIIGHSLGGNLAIELMNLIPVDGVLLLAAPPASYTNSLAPYLKLPDFDLTENKEENLTKVEAFVSSLTTNQEVRNYLKTSFLNTDPVFRDRLIEEFGEMKFSDQLDILKNNESTFIGCIMASDDVAANNEFLVQLNIEGVFDFFATISDSGHYSLLEESLGNIECIETFINKVK